MSVQKVECEFDIPEGYRFVRYSSVKKGERYLAHGKVRIASCGYDTEWPIVEKLPDCEESAENSKRHKHADSIHAWAEGAIIQFKLSEGDIWLDCPDNLPCWSVDRDYRIKPATKKITFRLWLTKSGKVAVWNLIGGGPFESPTEFKHWIGDWQSVEVEE